VGFDAVVAAEIHLRGFVETDLVVWVSSQGISVGIRLAERRKGGIVGIVTERFSARIGDG
jgi:hypothetical protein